MCYGLAVDPKDESSDFKSREIAAKIFANYAHSKQSDNPAFNGNQSHAHTAASVGKYLVCHDGHNCKIGTEFKAIDQIVVKPLGSVDDYISEELAVAAATSPSTVGAAALLEIEEITDEYFDITDAVQPERDFYMKDSTYSIVIPLMSREQEIVIDDKPVKDAMWSDFKKTIQNNSYESAFENLRTDIINSEEYKVLINLCFSAENIMLFNTLAGIQFYGSNDLYRSFIQTKNMLRSNMMVTMNARKYDYVPPATTNVDYTIPEVKEE